MPPTIVSSNAFKSMTNLLYKQKMGWPAHFRFPRNQGMRSVSKITPESKSYGTRRGQEIERNPPASIDLAALIGRGAGRRRPKRGSCICLQVIPFYGRTHPPPGRNIEIGR